MPSDKFALLIDSDNISAKYVDGILDEITKYGTPTYKRIYGDWTSNQSGKWKEELLDKSITPIQQFSNVSGKNATDSALIIDAMDILYKNEVDGFCIVSSDSDFTRLAARLRESGMQVIGMGEKKTPPSFRNACTKFVSLEHIHPTVTADESNESTLSQSAIERVIAGIVRSNSGDGKRTSLADVGNQLSNKFSDFDVRDFGYTQLSKFIEEMPRFTLDRNSGSNVTVEIASSQASEDAVITFVHETILSNGAQGIGLSELSNMVHAKFPSFNLKDYGYAQFSKFVVSTGDIEMFEDEQGNRCARMAQ